MSMEDMSLPEEIEKFSVSKEFFEEVLQAWIGTEIGSLEIDDGTAKITVPDTFFKEVASKRYKREIDSIDFDGEEVELALGDVIESGEEETKSDFNGEPEGNSEENEQPTEEEGTEGGSEEGASEEKENDEEVDKGEIPPKENAEEKEPLKADSIAAKTGAENNELYDDISRLERIRKGLLKED